jgi:hypothetical protein
MIIANPLYDVVFKSLMEDVEIAQGLISVLTGLNVTELHAKPRETAIPLEAQHNVTIYRLDYVATVRNDDGSHRKVLVEVQKAKLGSEIRRFRTYLGKQYMSGDSVVGEGGERIPADLPIVAIYILGFSLGDDVPPYCKVNRAYIDAITGGVAETRNDFIESLSHDMYVLQANRVGHRAGSELERLLSIFSQTGFAENSGHTITYPDPLTKAKNRLFIRILRHLVKLSSSKKVRERMDAEDQAYSEFESAVANKTKELNARLEEERRQKEDAQQQIRTAYEKLIENGFSEKEAKKLLGI